MDVAKSLRPLVVSLIPGNQRELNKLRQMREGLSNDISEIIDEFGPQLYENFEKVSHPGVDFFSDNTGPNQTISNGSSNWKSSRNVRS